MSLNLPVVTVPVNVAMLVQLFHLWSFHGLFRGGTAFVHFCFGMPPQRLINSAKESL